MIILDRQYLILMVYNNSRDKNSQLVKILCNHDTGKVQDARFTALCPVSSSIHGNIFYIKKEKRKVIYKFSRIRQ